MRLKNFRTRTQVAALWLLAFSPTTVRAHEFWIEPSTFTATVGQRVEVALRVGEHFKGEPVARKSDRIVKFAALRLDESGKFQEQPITGDEGDEPAGHFEQTQPGSNVLVFQTNHAQIELEGEKFEAYLEEKGLDGIRKLRAERNESDKLAKEIYSRCAKALVLSEDDNPVALDFVGNHTVGLPFEIVFDTKVISATSRYYTAAFKVLVHGKPMPDVQVTASTRQSPDSVRKKRSDENGVVRFAMTNTGPWLIECTYMRPVTDRDDADYESFWASLTFEFQRLP